MPEEPLSKAELIAQLSRLNDLHDEEAAHGQADDLLLEYIGDDDISDAFAQVEKWYA